MNELERAVLEKFLAGDHPTLARLRTQAQRARVISREFTGFGFFAYLDVAMGPPSPEVLPSNFELRDVCALVDGLSWGAGFVLSVRGGCLDFLEGHTFGEPWPRRIGTFVLSYEWEPRALDLAESAAGTES